MAFIVKKKIHGKEYYYLNENKRVPSDTGGTKVKTKTIAYLGKTKKEAEKKAKGIIKKMKKEKEAMKEKMEHKTSSNQLPTSRPKIEEKTKMVKKELSIENINELTNFCKRKGFVYPSSEIYGGFSGFWDFGHLGVELFNNIKKDWWNWFVEKRDDMEGIEASIISHPKTWKASGHLISFRDVAVVCKKCKKAITIDISDEGKVKCECGGEYEKQGEFNLLFRTQVGAINPEIAYLRGETAQAMFMDFKLIMDAARQKLPFGIAQIGKCFRNEIAPRDFLFRSREFTIGEFEFFIHPKEKKCDLLDKKHLNVKLNFLDAETQEKGNEELKENSVGKMLEEGRLEEWHAYWLAEQIMWFTELGLDVNKIKVREHKKSELSHYSSATFDIDYEYPFGSKEVAGNANRGQYDLTQHEKESKQKMEIFDEKTKEKIIPKVIEPTFGMERVFLAVIVNSYNYDTKRGNIVLKLHPKLAPIKVAIFPIVKTNKKFIKIARDIYDELKEEFNVVYDESGSLGRRYSRQDEIGTPYCITIDAESLKNKDVTIRLRDTTEQIRIKIKDLKDSLRKAIDGENILKFGKKVDTRKKI